MQMPETFAPIIILWIMIGAALALGSYVLGLLVRLLRNAANRE
ncbi:hypothetical protein [Deinococcus sp.]